MNNYDLPIWEHPSDYGGFSPDGDYLIYGRTRDSSILENSNYELIFEQLRALSSILETDKDEPFAYDFRASHWACGWVEYILIKQDSPDRLQVLAYEILGALSDYPCLSDEHYSEKQYDAIHDYWQDCGTREKMEYCIDAGVSKFAFRHGMPGEVFDNLQQNESFN